MQYLFASEEGLAKTKGFNLCSVCQQSLQYSMRWYCRNGTIWIDTHIENENFTSCQGWHHECSADDAEDKDHGIRQRRQGRLLLVWGGLQSVKFSCITAFLKLCAEAVTGAMQKKMTEQIISRKTATKMIKTNVSFVWRQCESNVVIFVEFGAIFSWQYFANLIYLSIYWALQVKAQQN